MPNNLIINTSGDTPETMQTLCLSTKNFPHTMKLGETTVFYALNFDQISFLHFITGNNTLHETGAKSEP